MSIEKKMILGAVAVCLLTGLAAGEKLEWLGRIRRDHPCMFFNKDAWMAVKARAEGPARAALRGHPAASGKICAAKRQPLAETGTPQKGVLLK